MNITDKIYAEKVLKHLFIGAQLDGVQFGMSPATIKVYFTHYKDVVDYGGQLYLTIESKWCLFDKRPMKFPKSAEEIEHYSEDEEYQRIFQCRRQKVINIELAENAPHLLITLENGYELFVNGVHDMYECWQAGVEFDEETWLIVATPGNDIAIWAPERF